MKKKYSLNYDIERDIDRVAAVKDILDQLATDPTPLELEQMGSYILYGKDENGLNAVQRGETTDGNRRYGSFKKKDDKLLSLDEIVDNPLADQQALKPISQKQNYTKKKPEIRKPKYDKKTGELIDIGDADIPGMQELWDRIAHLEHIVAQNEGKAAIDEDTRLLDNGYRLYQLKHMLIDVRRHQYYLKDAYKPTLHFQTIDHPKAAFYDWTSDASYWMPREQWQERVDNALLSSISRDINDYETRNNGAEVKWVIRKHTFDWENPLHIRALINNYDALRDQFREKIDTYGRTLLFDFERYRDMANLTELRAYILRLKIERVPYSDIINELQLKFGIKYNENHLCTILSREIPERIAEAARKYHLLLDTPREKTKLCKYCGRYLPVDPLFFVRNRSRKDGFSGTCKECEKKKRIERGGQGVNDRRTKEAQMYQV